MDEALIELGETIAAALPDAVLSTAVAFGELSVQAKPEGIVPVLTFLRDDSTCRFSVLIDVCGVDYPDREPRFVNGGYCVFNQRIGDYLTGDDCILEREPLERLASEGQLKAHCHAGFWQCMDTQREQQQLESLWASGDAPCKIW